MLCLHEWDMRSCHDFCFLWTLVALCLFVHVHGFVLSPHAASSSSPPPAIRAHRGGADGSSAPQPLQRAVGEGAGGLPQERGAKDAGPPRYGTHTQRHTHRQEKSIERLQTDLINHSCGSWSLGAQRDSLHPAGAVSDM